MRRLLQRHLQRAGAVFAAVLLFGAAISAADSATNGVPSDIRAIFDKPQYKNAAWGLRVLDGDNVVVDRNSQRLFYIGSVRKVFSVGQLLNAVGPQHTYDTPVYRTGAIAGDGVLHGNLIVVASGDLTMGGRRNPDGTIAVSNWDHNEADSLGNAVLTKPNPLAGYAALARAVRAAGITRVAGNVVIDDRLFKPFFFRDEFYVRPIFVNDDAVDVSVLPRGAPGSAVNVTTRPVSAALRVLNNLRIGPAGANDSLKIDPRLPACIGKPGCAATISGILPNGYTPPLTGSPTLVQTVRIVQPANYARTVFIEQLRVAGVTVAAPAVQQNPVALLPQERSYRAADKVAQLTGMPYGEDAKLVLKISYNIGADTSLLLLGVRNHANSMDDALAFERKNLQKRWGIPSTQYRFVDGSGGGETTATNAAVTTMLRELSKSPASQAFANALPILGIDGSLAFVKNFESDRSLAGAASNVRAKTGTYVAPSASGGLELKAQALGGYVTTKRGHHLTFQLVVNNVPIKNILDVTNVFQDEGTIAAMLWRDY
ncbi:MAG TPA: D-alanyl-D-alanine carboxypeptidase [Candidatus Baltobacteraceae bacterium]|nr:D-alanyl-D-alanine carboxypeptidase [Candidatus Baltobacteraceae bacterium]